MGYRIIKKIFSLTTVLFLISMYLFISVDWKIAVGIILFGWMMNLENDDSDYFNKQ